MSQLTAVTAVCTLKWLLLCSFCILLFLWESRVVLELRPLCWKNDGFFQWWQLEFHACRMKHIDGNWRSYELRWWLLLDDRSERHCCLVESCDILRSVCYDGSKTSHKNPHGFCLNVPLWDVWEWCVFKSAGSMWCLSPCSSGLLWLLKLKPGFFDVFCRCCWFSFPSLTTSSRVYRTLIIPAPQSPGCWRTLPLLYTAILRWKWSSNNGKRRCRKIQEKKRGGICSAIW